MKTQHLPVFEMVTISYFLAAALALTLLFGCGPDKPQTSNAPVAVAQPQPSRPAPPPAPAVDPREALLRVVTFEEAEAEYRNGQFAAAADMFARYTKDHPTNPWGFYMLGLSAGKDGRYAVAEKALRTAITLDPSHAKSRINLARVLLDAARPADALVELDTLFAADRATGEVFRLQGRGLYQQGLLVDAADAYREAIRMDDTDAWAMNNLALCLIDEGLFAEAVPVLARATELREDVAVFFNNLGMALEHEGQFRMAQTAYEQAIAIDGYHAVAEGHLARVSAIEDDPSTVPFDLATAAVRFTEDIASWSDEAVAREAPVDEAVSPADESTAAEARSGDAATPGTPTDNSAAAEAPIDESTAPVDEASDDGIGSDGEIGSDDELGMSAPPADGIDEPTIADRPIH